SSRRGDSDCRAANTSREPRLNRERPQRTLLLLSRPVPAASCGTSLEPHAFPTLHPHRRLRMRIGEGQPPWSDHEGSVRWRHTWVGTKAKVARSQRKRVLPKDGTCAGGGGWACGDVGS